MKISDLKISGVDYLNPDISIANKQKISSLLEITSRNNNPKELRQAYNPHLGLIRNERK